jgi:hypothetical protein
MWWWRFEDWRCSYTICILLHTFISMAYLLRQAQLASCAGWPSAAVGQWNICTQLLYGVGTVIHTDIPPCRQKYTHTQIQTSKHPHIPHIPHIHTLHMPALPRPIRALSRAVFCMPHSPRRLEGTKAFISKQNTCSTQYCVE